MTHRLALISFRLILGIGVLVTLVSQALYLQQAGVLNLFNYFGYYTNLSNLLAGIILVISALYLIKSRKPLLKDDLIRGAATLYMGITGLVYVTLLIDAELGLLLPWVNIVLHVIMPLAILCDWLYQPPRTRLLPRYILLWLIFPFVFLVYTLIRGAAIGWYPYPFLNPALSGGYMGVALYCLGILGAFFVVGWLLIKVGNVLKRHVA